MTIIEKPELKFIYRLAQAIKSQSVILWFMAFFLLIAGIIYKEQIMSWVLIIMGVLYFCYLCSWAYRMARVHILKVELDTETLTVTFQQVDKVLVQPIKRTEIFYKIVGSNHSSYNQIRFMQGEKTIVKQYAFGAWKPQDIEALDQELKFNGL